MALFVPKLRNKKVGLVVNHSSIVNRKHLLDTLLQLDIQVLRVFSPEHGFRGEEADGATIKDGVDQKSGLPIFSLYGKYKKPKPEWVADLDVIVFDIQDVGVRFYTYLSTLHLIMEAAAEQQKEVIVLDRPNPNGFYIDGPVLESEFSSFVGKHPVPIVYAMTIGEYALMINGERWLADSNQAVLSVIPLKNYDRSKPYALPVAPSPNLPTPTSVLLYPSLGLFEGTTVSIGRGTDHPFQCVGHPDYPQGEFVFTPKSVKASTSPKWQDQKCKGHFLGDLKLEEVAAWKKINLSFLLEFHRQLHDEPFYRGDGYFEKLAGTMSLRQALDIGATESEIRSSWQEGIDDFVKIRSKYLLYPDF